MIKNSRVEEGTTPSDQAGKPCDRIVDGVPLAPGESAPAATVEKVAKALAIEPSGVDKPEERA